MQAPSSPETSTKGSTNLTRAWGPAGNQADLLLAGASTIVIFAWAYTASFGRGVQQLHQYFDEEKLIAAVMLSGARFAKLLTKSSGETLQQQRWVGLVINGLILPCALAPSPPSQHNGQMGSPSALRPAGAVLRRTSQRKNFPAYRALATAACHRSGRVAKGWLAVGVALGGAAALGAMQSSAEAQTSGVLPVQGKLMPPLSGLRPHNPLCPARQAVFCQSKAS